MAHIQQTTFISLVRECFIPHTQDLRILEIGAYDFNGSIRKYFPNAQYVGVDLCEGPGVDMVGYGHEIGLPDESIDISISCECFEHDPHWVQTIKNMYRMTKPGGMLVMTCATYGRVEHGTRRSSAAFSPGTQFVGLDYYRNLGRKDFEAELDLPEMFSQFLFFVIPASKDLYFVGWKRGEPCFTGDVQNFEKRVAEIRKIRRFRIKLFDLPVSVARRTMTEQKFQDFACHYYAAIFPMREFIKSLGRIGRG